MAEVPGGAGIDIPVTVSVSWQYDASGQEAAEEGMRNYAASAMQAMGSVSRMTGLFTMLNVSGMRSQMMFQANEVSMLRLTTAQQRYNAALGKFGEGSKEATAAHAQLQIATLQSERAQQRLNMMQMRQYMEIIPAGIRVMQALHGILTMVLGVEKARLAFAGPAGWAILGAGAALMAGMAVSEYTQEQQMKKDIAKQTTLMKAAGMASPLGGIEPMGFQSGGRVPATGTYRLHAGEQVSAPHPAGGGGAGGQTIINLPMAWVGGMSIRDFAHVLMDEIEREKRTKYPQSTRAY